MNRIKYPRTYHLPWSLGVTNDDKTLSNVDQFIGKRVIVTEKLDGENRTFSQEYTHARSVESIDHYSQHWIKNFYHKINYQIPKGWRICGEDLYATHSIHYRALPSYFIGFSIWNENNECLSYDETKEYFELLNIIHAPVLYDGIWDENKIKSLYTGVSCFHTEANSCFKISQNKIIPIKEEILNLINHRTLDNNNLDVQEGYVVRLADSFKYDDFQSSVAKFVRANHVTTEDHWKNKEIIPNELK